MVSDVPVEVATEAALAMCATIATAHHLPRRVPLVTHAVTVLALALAPAQVAAQAPLAALAQAAVAVEEAAAARSVVAHALVAVVVALADKIYNPLPQPFINS